MPDLHNVFSGQVADSQPFSAKRQLFDMERVLTCKVTYTGSSKYPSLHEKSLQRL